MLLLLLLLYSEWLLFRPRGERLRERECFVLPTTLKGATVGTSTTICLWLYTRTQIGLQLSLSFSLSLSYLRLVCRRDRFFIFIVIHQHWCHYSKEEKEDEDEKKKGNSSCLDTFIGEHESSHMPLCETYSCYSEPNMHTQCTFIHSHTIWCVCVLVCVYGFIIYSISLGSRGWALSLSVVSS